jgi:hypothetical protein
VPRYEIAVTVNPNAQPPATAPNSELQPMTSAETAFNKQLTLGGVAKGIIGLNALRSIGSTLTGQVGAYTGNAQTQRNIDNTLQFLQYAGEIAIGGAIGVASVGAQILNEKITEGIQRRNENLDSQYRRFLRGNSFSGNR